MVYLGLGTNLGNREGNLKNAIHNIEENIGIIISKSSIYETSAWGKIDQNAFLNQVIAVETLLNPVDLLAKTQAIEKNLGRIKTQHWGERIIDIDILYYNNLIVETENLTIPHKYIQARKFVLMPLREIAPNFMHPILQKTTAELLENCLDNGECYIFK